jgi:hypothetical protein
VGFIADRRTVQIFSFECEVTKEQLTAIVDRFAEGHFFVVIDGIENEEALARELPSKCPEVIHVIVKQTLQHFIAKIRAPDFPDLVETLLSCEAEVVTFYFPGPGTSIDRLVSTRGLEQRKVILQGVCPIACTWVTENYELFFLYDARVFTSEIKQEIKQLIGIERSM